MGNAKTAKFLQEWDLGIVVEVYFSLTFSFPPWTVLCLHRLNWLGGSCFPFHSLKPAWVDLTCNIHAHQSHLQEFPENMGIPLMSSGRKNDALPAPKMSISLFLGPGSITTLHGKRANILNILRWEIIQGYLGGPKQTTWVLISDRVGVEEWVSDSERDLKIFQPTFLSWKRQGMSSPLEPPEWTYPHLDFSPVEPISDFWPPKLQVCVFLSHRYCDNLLQHQQEANAYPKTIISLFVNRDWSEWKRKKLHQPSPLKAVYWMQEK